MVFFWLAVLLLAVIAPPIVLVLAGLAAARLAGRAGARRRGPEYPTAQMLALTYREGH